MAPPTNQGMAHRLHTLRAVRTYSVRTQYVLSEAKVRTKYVLSTYNIVRSTNSTQTMSGTLRNHPELPENDVVCMVSCIGLVENHVQSGRFFRNVKESTISKNSTETTADLTQQWSQPLRSFTNESIPCIPCAIPCRYSLCTFGFVTFVEIFVNHKKYVLVFQPYKNLATNLFFDSPLNSPGKKGPTYPPTPENLFCLYISD